MNVLISGLPAIFFIIGAVIVLAIPVWLSAKIVGAEHPTLMRAILALATGQIITAVLSTMLGDLTYLLAPVWFVIAFRQVLGTSTLGAIVLGILSAAGYYFLARLFGSGVTVQPDEAALYQQILTASSSALQTAVSASPLG